MPSQGVDELIGESIDRLINVQLRFTRSHGLWTGDRSQSTRPTHLDFLRFQGAAYKAARTKFEKPLTLSAAELLRERVSPGRNVILVTGTGTPPVLPQGETDGPTGLAALGRAIHFGLGGCPVAVMERCYWEPVAASFRAIGLMPVAFERHTRLAYKAAFADFEYKDDPINRSHCLLEEIDPVAIIAVEKTGANKAGVIHSATGEAKSGNARIDHLFRLGRDAGILTIGIGDWGNEIGMGTIWETVREHQPWGKKCLCPCGEGIADATETDVLVAACIANWGAYGVAAMLAILVGDREIFHDGDLERQMLLDCVRAGAAEGETRISHPGVDGTSIAAQMCGIGLLEEIVTNSLRLEPLLEQSRVWEREVLRSQGVLSD